VFQRSDSFRSAFCCGVSPHTMPIRRISLVIIKFRFFPDSSCCFLRAKEEGRVKSEGCPRLGRRTGLKNRRRNRVSPAGSNPHPSAKNETGKHGGLSIRCRENRLASSSLAAPIVHETQQRKWISRWVFYFCQSTANLQATLERRKGGSGNFFAGCS
jgi:hypothetical protein